MEELLDSLWFKIVALVSHLKDLLDILLSPLNALGPAFAIFVIALLTVCLAKFLTRTIKTKRYKKLKEEFTYWYNLRQEAMKCEDREKSKLLAKNIDQAKLNKLYYNYFLEGFFLSLLTRYLPIFCFLAYVNEAYKPAVLIKLIGRDYLFNLGQFRGEPLLIGSNFWFIICIVIIYVAWAVGKRTFFKKRPRRKSQHDREQAPARV